MPGSYDYSKKTGNPDVTKGGVLTDVAFTLVDNMVYKDPETGREVVFISGTVIPESEAAKDQSGLDLMSRRATAKEKERTGRGYVSTFPMQKTQWDKMVEACDKHQVEGTTNTGHATKTIAGRFQLMVGDKGFLIPAVPTAEGKTMAFEPSKLAINTREGTLFERARMKEAACPSELVAARAEARRAAQASARVAANEAKSVGADVEVPEAEAAEPELA